MRTISLGEIVSDARPGFASGEDTPDGIIQIRMNNVTTEGTFDWSKLRRVPAPKGISELTVKPNDILLNATNSPDLVGKNAVFKEFSEPVTFSNHFIRLRLDERIADSRLISRWLTDQWQRGKFKSMCRQWVNQASLNKDQLLSLEIPFPPLSEQRRIAAILDQADDLRRKRREALEQIGRLREALFVSEFIEGGDYPKSPLSKVCELITDGTHYTPTYAEVGTIFLSAKNVTSKRIDWDDVKYIPESLHRELQKRVSPRMDDILLAKNGTTGVAALVDREVVFDIYVSLALLRPGPKIIPSYLLASLNSAVTASQFKGVLKGIGVPNLHLVDIRSAIIPIPPLEIQRAFSERLSDFDRLEHQHRAHLAKLDALFASLQHRAFRGEL